MERTPCSFLLAPSAGCCPWAVSFSPHPRRGWFSLGHCCLEDASGFTVAPAQVRPGGWMWGGRRGCSQPPDRHLAGDEEQRFVISHEVRQPLLGSTVEGHRWTDHLSPPRLAMDKRGTCGSRVARSGIPRPRVVLEPAGCARLCSLGR